MGLDPPSAEDDPLAGGRGHRLRRVSIDRSGPVLWERPQRRWHRRHDRPRDPHRGLGHDRRADDSLDQPLRGIHNRWHGDHDHRNIAVRDILGDGGRCRLLECHRALRHAGASDHASGIEMLLVPPGTFSMGCSASNLHECVADENPVHAVTITNAYSVSRCGQRLWHPCGEKSLRGQLSARFASFIHHRGRCLPRAYRKENTEQG